MNNDSKEVKQDLAKLFPLDTGVVEAAQVIVEDLEELIAGSRDEKLLGSYSGICCGILNASKMILDIDVSNKFDDCLDSIMSCWPLALKSRYTVPHPNSRSVVLAGSIFRNSTDLERWTGAYRKLRKQLAQFVVDALKELINEFRKEQVA